MQILEQCTSAWPMPDLAEQVDALRAAFSADINRPFELKPSFPYSSPSEGYHPSPPMDMHYPVQLPLEHSFEHQPPQMPYTTGQTITPPISADPRDIKHESPGMQQSMGMMPSSHSTSTVPIQSTPLVDPMQWNPSKLISQWDSAFAISPSAMAPPGTNSPPMNMPMTTSSSPMGPPQPQQQQQHHPQQQSQYLSQYPQAAGMTSFSPLQQAPQPSFVGSSPVFVSPRDWQQSVASVYDPEGSLKRRWHSTGMGNQSQGRIR